MKLEQVRIKGLWHEYDIDWKLYPDVNILVGGNGTGKSASPIVVTAPTGSISPPTRFSINHPLCRGSESALPVCGILLPFRFPDNIPSKSFPVLLRL